MPPKPRYGDEHTVQLTVHLPRPVKDELRRRARIETAALPPDGQEVSMSSLAVELIARGLKVKLPKGV